MNTDGIDLTGKRLNQFGDKLVAIGPLDTYAAIQHSCFDAKSLADLFRQWLRLPGSTELCPRRSVLQFPRRTKCYELAAVQNREGGCTDPLPPSSVSSAKWSYRLHHASVRDNRQFASHAGIESRTRFVEQQYLRFVQQALRQLHSSPLARPKAFPQDHPCDPLSQT